ncbi:Uncharacterised protein [Bordetella pertussis]|nr:Uncharacterised protein [Bordetella pertussis]
MAASVPYAVLPCSQPQPPFASGTCPRDCFIGPLRPPSSARWSPSSWAGCTWTGTSGSA